jgi:hypothetical protein
MSGYSEPTNGYYYDKDGNMHYFDDLDYEQNRRPENDVSTESKLLAAGAGVMAAVGAVTLVMGVSAGAGGAILVGGAIAAKYGMFTWWNGSGLRDEYNKMEAQKLENGDFSGFKASFSDGEWLVQRVKGGVVTDERTVSSDNYPRMRAKILSDPDMDLVEQVKNGIQANPSDEGWLVVQYDESGTPTKQEYFSEREYKDIKRKIDRKGIPLVEVNCSMKNGFQATATVSKSGRLHSDHGPARAVMKQTPNGYKVSAVHASNGRVMSEENWRNSLPKRAPKEEAPRGPQYG